MLAIMKGVSSFGAIIILLLGLGMTGITIYGYANRDIFLGNNNASVILSSIIGICGIKRGNGCCIFIFQILIAVLLLAFLALALASIIIPGSMFGQNCTSQNNYQIIKSTSSLYQLSQSVFCHSSCKCSLSDNTISHGGYNSYEQTSLIKNFNRSDSAAKNFQSCNLNISENDENLITLISSLELTLKCSGWCKQNDPGYGNLIYQFSDVNNGKPQKHCYNAIKDSLSNLGQILGISLFAIAGFMLLIFCCNLCICCSSQNRNKSARERLIFVDHNDYRTAH